MYKHIYVRYKLVDSMNDTIQFGWRVVKLGLFKSPIPYLKGLQEEIQGRVDNSVFMVEEMRRV